MLNIQSLLPKVVSLQHDQLKRFEYDFFVLTETWLRSATASRLVTFPGYTLHRADRPGEAGYGGVAILAHHNYQTAVIAQPSADCADCRLESLWLRVKPATGPHFTLAAVYRPPRRTAAALQADFGELELQYQRAILQHTGHVIIMGDLNSGGLSCKQRPLELPVAAAAPGPPPVELPVCGAHGPGGAEPQWPPAAARSQKRGPAPDQRLSDLGGHVLHTRILVDQFSMA
ncbi:hypothetical protein FJT64_009231 [Amphibalanus amphitrite]|uniref:Endonuclease/exonuclease/phosphatase domain-containing protein n=1 Tax=Amphibalanus amphitrite TaxID=1232801 RepID=A0A6A4VIA6_AMPAM|nr:hypothetical protein FJT64_009231 [Amphibalanus amphitrite]